MLPQFLGMLLLIGTVAFVVGSECRLTTEVAAWEQRRNGAGCQIKWTFTRQDADQKLARHYVT